MSAVRMGGVRCIRNRKQMQCRVESSFASMRVHREIKREIGNAYRRGLPAEHVAGRMNVGRYRLESLATQ
jgi:hypothetical protein